MAVGAGIDVFRSGGVGTPSVSIGGDFLKLPPYADRLAWCRNDMFSEISRLGQSAKLPPWMYARIKALYNPAFQVADFFGNNIWPGSFSEDGRKLPDGFPNAVPFAADMRPEMRLCAMQTLQWSNFQSIKYEIPFKVSGLGDGLLEIKDDLQRGQIYFEFVEPWEIVELERRRGNLVYYAVQYLSQQGETFFTYRREVDKFSTRVYHNKELISELSNPYGFVTARWLEHIDLGKDRGAPALWAVYDKVAWLNSLASHGYDQLNRLAEGALGIATEGDITPLFNQEGTQPAGMPADPASMKVWKFPATTRTFPFVPDVPLGDMLLFMRDLQAEIAKGVPYLDAFNQLRSISGGLTGPGAERMIGDAAAPLYAAEDRYNGALERLLEMCATMGGYRYAHRNDPAPEGMYNGWAADTEQQKRYAPFGLDSYAAGKLRVVISPHLLLTPTAADRMTTLRDALAIAKEYIAMGVPPLNAMREVGVSEELLATIVKPEEEPTEDGGEDTDAGN